MLIYYYATAFSFRVICCCIYVLYVQYGLPRYGSRLFCVNVCGPMMICTMPVLLLIYSD